MHSTVKSLALAFLLSLTLISHASAQRIPANAHRTAVGSGWACNQGFVKRQGRCVSPGRVSNSEIRRLMIQASLATYPGNCPCPWNADRAGRRCGGRSAYSRPGGYSPICYPSDITDAQVRRFRQQFRALRR